MAKIIDKPKEKKTANAYGSRSLVFTVEFDGEVIRTYDSYQEAFENARKTGGVAGHMWIRKAR